MKTIVITGSTRGIGWHLADAFLSLGCNVVISGRTAAAVEKALDQLAQKYPRERMTGQPCDVSNREQMQRLWEVAAARFERVDIWINNAGLGQPQIPAWELPADLVRDVLNTNLAGTLNGVAVAYAGMQAQGGGAIYNLEGLGSGGGRKVPGLALYGMSKAAIHYYDGALFAELKGSNVIAGSIQPGMVATDMIIQQYADKPEEWAKVKPIFNIIGERPEVVAAELARKVLANTKNGARLQFGNSFTIAGRFLSAPFKKREIFK